MADDEIQLLRPEGSHVSQLYLQFILSYLLHSKTARVVAFVPFKVWIHCKFVRQSKQVKIPSGQLTVLTQNHNLKPYMHWHTKKCSTPVEEIGRSASVLLCVTVIFASDFDCPDMRSKLPVSGFDMLAIEILRRFGENRRQLPAPQKVSSDFSSSLRQVHKLIAYCANCLDHTLPQKISCDIPPCYQANVAKSKVLEFIRLFWANAPAFSRVELWS